MAAAFIQGGSVYRTWGEIMQFASAAASICVQSKGTMVSMPTLEQVEQVYVRVEFDKVAAADKAEQKTKQRLQKLRALELNEIQERDAAQEQELQAITTLYLQ